MRQASEFTVAIRGMLEKNPALSHGAARPLLEAAGFPLAKEPKTISENLSKFNSVASGFNRPLWSDKAQVDTYYTAVCKECGFDAEVSKAVRKEAELNRLFKAEQANFNQIKFNWSKDRPASSAKPNSTPKNAKSHAAVAAKKPGRKPGSMKVVNRTPSTYVEELQALGEIEVLGGAAAVREKIASMKADVERYESLLVKVDALSKRIKSAA